jgi:hypothetical protein
MTTTLIDLTEAWSNGGTVCAYFLFGLQVTHFTAPDKEGDGGPDCHNRRPSQVIQGQEDHHSQICPGLAIAYWGGLARLVTVRVAEITNHSLPSR